MVPLLAILNQVCRLFQGQVTLHFTPGAANVNSTSKILLYVSPNGSSSSPAPEYRGCYKLVEVRVAPMMSQPGKFWPIDYVAR